MIWVLGFFLPYVAYAASARDATRVLSRCDIANNKHGIAAFASDGELIGAACDTRLGKSIDQAITVDVTHTPPYLGNITIGEHSFHMHSNPSSESEPVCSRVYNDRELEIDCSIPKHSIDQGELAEALGEEHGSCFKDESATDQPMQGRKLIDTSLATTESGNFTGIFADDPTANLSKRQGGCSTSQHSRLVDNGYPHQDLLHRQTNISSGLRMPFISGDLSRLLADTRRPHTSVDSTPVALQRPKAQQTHMHSILMCIPFNGSVGASQSPLFTQNPIRTPVTDKKGRPFVCGIRWRIPHTRFKTPRLRLVKKAVRLRLIRVIQLSFDHRTRMAKAADTIA